MSVFTVLNKRVRRHEALAGYILVELEGVPWDFWIRDAGDRIIFCGELGHARWILYRIAWKYTVTKMFDDAVAELASRVGVELDSTRTKNPTETHRSPGRTT